MSEPNILPDSRLRIPKNVVRGKWGLNWAPIFCASCGKDGGLVPEDHLNCNFVCYLCDPCAEKMGDFTGLYVEPDAVFWEKVKQAQLEKEKRELTGAEVAEALKDSTHYLSKLVKDRDLYLKKAR